MPQLKDIVAQLSPKVVAAQREMFIKECETRKMQRLRRERAARNAAHARFLIAVESMEEGRIVQICSQKRCSKKKASVRNSRRPSPDMRDGVGSIPTSITIKRFGNSRLTCVCKSRIY